MPAQRAFWKRLGFAFISLTLALAALSPVASAPQVAHATGPYLVDSTIDAPDAINNGICADSGGHCTLRAALQEAFDDVGPTNITFLSALAGSTFVLDNAYEALIWAGDNITVNGENKNITISGASLGPGKSIFTIKGSHNVLENLTVRQAPQDGVQMGDFDGLGVGSNNLLSNLILLQNGASGVYVLGGSGGGGQSNSIAFSHIGSASNTSCGFGNGIGVTIDQAASGTTVASSNIFCNSGRGIQVINSSNVFVSGNDIGIYYGALLGNGGDGIYASGTTGLNVGGNWISDNNGDGMLLANSTQATIQANYIGTNAYAATANPNAGNGIELSAGSNQNLIGGLALVDRNTISGNGLSGVLLDGSGTQTNTVVGNYIGTNLTGTAAIANGSNGVRLENNTHDNTIGGHGSTAVANLISGNSLDGVLLMTGATHNTVDGNRIGVGTNNLLAIPNGLGGVALLGAPANNIGSAVANTAQYIDGNHLQGVYVSNADSTFIDQSNNIGISPDGNTGLGNGAEGVLIIDSSNTTVVADVIVLSGGAGVAVIGSGSVHNKLTPRVVQLNGGLPIDLGDDGATANDPGDADSGPNGLLNYPVITSAAGHVITGTACAFCTVVIYQAEGNPAAAGGGGFQFDEVGANGAGVWTATLPGGLTRFQVTLLACEAICGPTSNTSEMSPRPQLFLPLARR